MFPTLTILATCMCIHTVQRELKTHENTSVPIISQHHTPVLGELWIVTGTLPQNLIALCVKERKESGWRKLVGLYMYNVQC